MSFLIKWGNEYKRSEQNKPSKVFNDVLSF